MFSLVFYALSFLLLLFKVGMAPIMFSISMLLSLVWVVLVLMEIMKSGRISNSERLLLALFIIIAGIVYFYLLRERVTGIKIIKKK